MLFSLAMNPGEEESETMNYAMLNSDEPSTAEQLEKYSGEIAWEYLRPHFEAGNLIWVSAEISLTEAGYALTNDESDRVKTWKKEGMLVIPSEPHAAFWEESQARFRALVVSPFVLVQPLEDADS